MFLQKLKKTTAVLLAVIVVAACSGTLVNQTLMAATPDPAQFGPPPGNSNAVSEHPIAGNQDKPIQFVSPKSGGIERVITQPAVLMAFEAVDVLPPVPGVLKKLSVNVGERVKKGELLAEIEAPDLLKDLEQARINVELARAKVALQQAQLQNALAEQHRAQSIVTQRQAELAVAQAELDRQQQALKRTIEVLGRTFVDLPVLDEAVAKVDVAKNRVEAAKAALVTAKIDSELKQGWVNWMQADLRVKQLYLESSRLALERAELALGFTRITAPFDGVVAKRNIYGEAYVSPKNAVPIVRIIRTDRMRLIVQVPDNDAVYIRVGMPVNFVLDPQQGKAIETKIDRISWQLDEKTRSLRVEADISNPEGLLRESQGIANIKLGIIRPNALIIPRSCLCREHGPDAVVLVRDGKAVVTKIVVGQTQNEFVEVLSGLSADDVIVVEPQGLKNGDIIPKR